MCRNVSSLLLCLFGHLPPLGFHARRKRVHPYRKWHEDAVDSWPPRIDMDTNYDEDVCDNHFFRELKKAYEPIFKKAVKEGWILCIPRRGSFNETALDEELITSHVLIPIEDTPITKFRTLSGRDVELQNKVLTIEFGAGKVCTSRILFEETFYNEERCKYHVWCIEHPLEREALVTRIDVIVVTNLHEAMNLLWEAVQEKSSIKDLEVALEEFKHTNKDVETQSLGVLRDSVAALYAECLGILLKDDGVRDRCTNSRHFLQSIKIAVESYILNALRDVLPQSVVASTAAEDANLNKIIRNLRGVRLWDLGVRADLYDGVQRGKLELARLDRFTTVLEKLECLKRAIRYISQGVSAISSDDLLPVLIFLVIGTGLPNWMAQLTFMKQFRFSVNSPYEADESGFLITSLEAAIEHIKSGVLMDSYPILEFSRSFKENAHETSSLAYLFSCIKKKDLSEVERLLSVDTTDFSTNIPLCHPLCSCESCERNLSRNFHTNRLTVTSADEEGLTPLHIAALCGEVTIIDFLLNLSSDADVSVADANGITPLHCACAKGHQNTVLLLLHANADPSVADARLNTPLHLAADHGHEACVKALLYFTEQMRLPLDPSPANINGDTPLHHASRWGYGGIVAILLEYGANAKASNKRGQTPLSLAHSKHVLALLEHAVANSKEAPRQRNSNSQRTLSRLQSKVQSLEKKDKQSKYQSSNPRALQRTVDLLFSAIAAGDICLAYYYLGLGGLAPKKKGLTRTDFCHPLCNCEHCVPTSVEESVEKSNYPSSAGLGINVCNSNNETALHIASAAGSTEIVQFLLDAGANVNVATKSEGRTPLHLACLMNKVQVVKMFLNCASCEIDVKDRNGDTPLHIVARDGNVKLVELLVRYGANTKIRNLEGRTPLQEVEKEMAGKVWSLTFSEVLKILKRTTAENLTQESEGSFEKVFL